MTDSMLEKVIKGLECCLANGHKNCPYKSTDEGIDKVISCTTYLMQDAIALLKAQQPRVMTLEEARDVEVVWVEDRATNEVFLCLVKNNMNDSELYKYGIQWRVWNARPTDEQRDAVKWE